MDKEKGNDHLRNKSNSREQMLSLYDATPYPAAMSHEKQPGVPLLDHWINSAIDIHYPALHATSNILVAGCGSGEEAIMLAKHYPEANVVGIDFSRHSIEKAKKSSANEKLTNIGFEVADLTSSSWLKNYDPFDFVLCHGVADYVEDIEALMQNFKACISEFGIVYLAVNSERHPAKRIQNAFFELGVEVAKFEDTSQQRSMLQLVDQLIVDNSGIKSLGNAAASYLNIDIFPPIAHHLSFDQWRTIGTNAGLYFCGSMEALDGLVHLQDEQLPLLFSLDRAALSAWMIKLRERPGMQLLFSRRKPLNPGFDKNEIWNWRPRLASCVGALPEMISPPDQAMHLTLQFQGILNFVIYSNAYELEVMRNCDGHRSLQQIVDDIPVRGNAESLKACLFRAYHYGILQG